MVCWEVVDCVRKAKPDRRRKGGGCTIKAGAVVCVVGERACGGVGQARAFFRIAFYECFTGHGGAPEIAGSDLWTEQGVACALMVLGL